MLPIANTKVSAEFTLSGPTLVWAIGQSVAVGDLRSHNGKVWKAKVAHVTHAGWEPSAAAWAVWEEQA